jgi:MerR family redox-sensitive transcriptional activator SoxR
MPTKSQPPPELSVGELSSRSGVAVSALHFYEAQGLITSRRTSGYQRRYRRDTLRRVAVIKAAQQVGITLRTVKEALDELASDGAPSRTQWRQLSEHWRQDLDERIAGLQALRDRLGGCIGCGCLSLDLCSLVNPGDRLSARGPGAHNLAAGPRQAG